MADQARDRSFDRIAILVLSIEWVLFGSMHFSMIEATKAMIPFGSDTFKHHAAVVTGILEVSTGVLILVPSFRQWAAAASIGLLILLTPAMYQILQNPDSVSSLKAWATPFRVVLLPNNIFLAICSVHLWRHPDAILARLPRPPPEPWTFAKPVTLIVPALLLMSNAAGFLALMIGAPGHLGTAFLWAMGCIASGALIGFLFGVPRVNPAYPATGKLLDNTNVEAVSDWLTKILVGVSLVNLQAIGAFTGRLADELAPALEASRAFAIGLIVYFFVVGIIQGYILTRMFLKPEFEDRTDSASA